MKSAIKVLVASIAVLFTCSAWAAKQTVDGVEYTYTISSGKSKITNVNIGTVKYVEIPTSLGGYPVRAIGDDAFSSKFMYSVEIPDGVTSIGNGAFADCDELESVTIPDSVTMIDDLAFVNCTVLERVTIPDGLMTLGVDVFYGCGALKEVYLPAKFVTADVMAKYFRECPADMAIATSANVGGLGWHYKIINGKAEICYDDDADAPTIPKATSGAVVIPDTFGGFPVTSIGWGAFAECGQLTSVSIPGTVTSIGDEAFYECYKLESLTIPPSVTSIGDDAFSDCWRLPLVVPDTVTSIGDGAFWGCEAMADANGFVIVRGVLHYYTDLGYDVVIPDSVTRIGSRAFSSCWIDSVTIPSSVTSIGDFAFRNCSIPDSIDIPASVESIGTGAFWGCEALADKDGFVIVRGVLYYYAGDAAAVTIPGGVTGISANAFRDNDSIESVTIPASVTSIGQMAFLDCKNLTVATIPSSVTSIGHYAFYDKTMLSVPLKTVHVEMGDTDRVKDLLTKSRHNVSGITFKPDVAAPHTVTFNANGGSVSPATRLVTSGMALGILPEAMLYGYALDGWFTAPEGGVKITETTVVTADVTYYAHWTKMMEVTFNANGGSVFPATRFVRGGMAIGALPEPVLAGYLFVGWFASLSGGEEITAATIVTADATVYARWTEVTASTWFTRRDEALAEAKRTGKKVFLIRGRDTCGNTMFTKNTSCEDPAVKAKLIAKCVLWYCNIDGAYGDESKRYKSESSTLPLVCVIDPNDAEHFLKRSNGPLTADQVLALIADIPYPAVSGPGTVDPEAVDPFYPGDLSCYQVLNPADIWDPFRASKAVTLMGVAYFCCDVVGIVELKIGKLKNYQGKVSGSVTSLDGKKYTIKSQKCSFGDNLASSLNLEVKGLGSMRIAIGSIGGANVFSGSLGKNKWHVQTGNVGGNWGKGRAAATVDIGDVSVFAGTVLEDLLPINEVATVSRGRWSFAKAASVKWAKPKAGQTAVMQDATGKGLVVDTSKGKTNLSGLKLTYTPKSGIFKGSFKVYALNGARLNKYTMSVNGVVVDGIGYGRATCKRPVVAWKILVE